MHCRTLLYILYFRSVVMVIFKVFFMLKCIKMMYFYFLKIIFKINISKQFKKYKKLIFNKKS